MQRVHYLLQDWADVPAGVDWLNPAEQQHLETLRFEKRRKDWLLGRFTAKQALLSLGAAGPGESQRLAVLAADDGSPFVTVDGEALDVSLSLSHSNARALCVVASGFAVGCDIERIEAMRSDKRSTPRISSSICSGIM